MSENLLIWVDELDNMIGYGEKLDTHIRSQLHRAFSIFIFDTVEKKMLIQRRAQGKYHSGGLWSNACCSHPLKDEGTLMEQIGRSLERELGILPKIAKIRSTDATEDGPDAWEERMLAEVSNEGWAEEETQEMLSYRFLSKKGCDNQKTYQLTADNEILYYAGVFLYEAKYTGLSEHEIDRVFLYCPDKSVCQQISLNPEEASEFCWISVEELSRWLEEHPEEFSAWFPMAYELILQVLS